MKRAVWGLSTLWLFVGTAFAAPGDLTQAGENREQTPPPKPAVSRPADTVGQPSRPSSGAQQTVTAPHKQSPAKGAVPGPVRAGDQGAVSQAADGAAQGPRDGTAEVLATVKRIETAAREGNVALATANKNLLDELKGSAPFLWALADTLLALFLLILVWTLLSARRLSRMSADFASFSGRLDLLQRDLTAIREALTKASPGTPAPGQSEKVALGGDGRRDRDPAGGSRRSEADAGGSGGAPPLAESREDSPPQPPAPDERRRSSVSDSFSSVPHGRIAILLSQLQKEAPQLAQGFASPQLREQFSCEFDKPLIARLIRFTEIIPEGEAALREHWLVPDLVPTLDALARFLSEAIKEGRNGHAVSLELAEELKRRLYRCFDSACREEGWFGIEPVVPFETQFDPGIHHAVGGQEVPGAAGLVVAIKAIGQLHPGRGSVLRKAEVVVGR
jgi:hypothetical protein